MKELNFEQTTKVLLNEFTLEDVYVYVNLKTGIELTKKDSTMVKVTSGMKNKHIFSGRVYGDEILYKFIENIRDTQGTSQMEFLELPVKKMKFFYTSASPTRESNNDDDEMSIEEQKMFVNFTISSIVIDQEKLANSIRYIPPFEYNTTIKTENEGLLSMYSPSSDNSSSYEVKIREDNSQSDLTPFSL